MRCVCHVPSTTCAEAASAASASPRFDDRAREEVAVRSHARRAREKSLLGIGHGRKDLVVTSTSAAAARAVRASTAATAARTSPT